MTYAYPVAAIRAAEQPLLDAQSEPDELMRQAAHAVAIAAQTMLTSQPTEPGVERVLVLVGSGGNGGDGLYAGAALAAAGYPVDAVLLGETVHQRARDAFLEAGGFLLDGFPEESRHLYRLVIDALLGIGGSSGLRRDVAVEVQLLHSMDAPILSVDVPSGIEADTGVEPEPYVVEHQSVPAHVSADVTLTFGGLRYAHCLSTACGEVLVTNIAIAEQRLAGGLTRLLAECDAPVVFASRAMSYPRRYEWPTRFHSPRPEAVTPIEPGPHDDKYTGGVVGVLAGSPAYPGAALLCVNAAVRATSSMVRYVGGEPIEIVRAHPEVVATERLADAGRVQTWVVGPGRGTDEAARAELAETLDAEVPVLLDADALTLLARHEELRTAVRERPWATVLSPHAGEFARLADAMKAGVDIPDPRQNPVQAIERLAIALDCAVILKGRFTLIAYPTGSRISITAVDAGTSWAATPGSGDVLSGLAGARMAFRYARGRASVPRPAAQDDVWSCYVALAESVQIHGVAAWLSAQTPDGPAATSASRIAKYIPRATARLTLR
ncbi:bifunctional ADP-dependent NAD(P)H-hydrate dehydratase/NAD(P)H-hydrate epimerase [Corynebacterium guangdongense]|nr:bifunctional ADP-dependent NAD(P)H-hydrate dehydratase/NAD(P)H-hydrate epimerase [Corynebacterium guangdongense]WJZ19094.1 Bifunctional NAD(P)H-hydrate repair enzyme Nnr [Corynebacterium guangdongense]